MTPDQKSNHFQDENFQSACNVSPLKIEAGILFENWNLIIGNSLPVTSLRTGSGECF